MVAASDGRAGVRGGRTRRFAARVVDAFVPPGIVGGSKQRLIRAAHVTRLAVAASALSFGWLLPGATASQRRLFVLLVAAVYLPYALAIYAVTRRWDGRRMWLWSAAGDLGIVFLFQATLPPTRLVALFGYLLLVAFYAYIGGLVAGASVAGLAVIASVGTMVFLPGGRLEAYELWMYAATLGSLVFLLDAASREQRQAVHRSDSLHESLRSLSSTNDLGEILAAVTRSARDSVGGMSAAVLLVEDGELVPEVMDGFSDVPDLQRLRRDAPATPDAGPSAVALSTGRAVVVEDLATDERFGRWAALGERMGFASMVATPLAAGDAPFGVLNVYFAAPRKFDAGDLDLLLAHADQAAGALLRGLAYRRERAAAARLEEADRLKSDFVSTVSHELRTPLVSVRGLADTLVTRWEQTSEEQRRDFARRIARGGEELQRIVEELLDFSRLEAGGVELHPRSLLLARAVDDCVESCAGSLERHRVGVDVSRDIEVHADPEAVRRVLGNLLTNAAKFSAPGSAIEVRAEVKGDQAIVGVRDEGPGIPAGELERIFDRYYRGTADGSRGGTGVGLSIARTYVEQQHGRIWVESTVGHGSTFSFTLPLVRHSSTDRRRSPVA